MAVAITEFSGFCGFLPVEKIAEYLSFVPELVELVTRPIAEAFRQAVVQPQPTHESIQACLKDVFSKLMSADDKAVQHEVFNLVNRYDAGGAKPVEAGLRDLVLELNRQFPGDVGIFCAFLLNVVKLQAGQAVFLKANEPHAYIYGGGHGFLQRMTQFDHWASPTDIMECMATSDNVVRAGLTPKLRDVPTLTSMLTYTWGPADSQIMPPTPWRSTKSTTIYDPPIEEFSVLLTKLGPQSLEEHEAIDGPSILIVAGGDGVLKWKERDGTEGEVAFEKEGAVFFLGAGVPTTFVAGTNGLTFYRAFVEVP
ncbi:Mannose-6-phosphate isomerase [Tulasnella sp. 403]|nr:Mannose-6-phosphate isomerase [Tulasnella sp. 403]